MIPVVLTIAGSDCSSGAGIQADLKTFSYHGTHGLTALTCVVAETPQVLRSIHPVPPAILQDQLEVLLKGYPVAAVKTGMLHSKAHVVAVTEILSDYDIPIVVDPVMVASSGSSLLMQNAVDAYRERLFPIASMITPNLPEAEVLLGRSVRVAEDMESAAEELASTYEVDCLLKGGHLPQSNERLDILWSDGQAHPMTASTIDIACTHGTGCTLSAAITAHLAHGANPVDAVTAAKQWVHAAILNSFTWENDSGEKKHCLNHLRPGSL